MQATRAAFHALAYKRFHHTPIYLEYAPADVFDTSNSTISTTRDDQPIEQDHNALVACDSTALTGVAEADAADDAAEACSLYVKNLAFESTADSVRRLFDQAASSCGGCLRAVRLVSSRRPDGKMVPKGFGFVELGDHDTAKAVLKKLQGTLLDGHHLQLQLSMQKNLKSATKVRLCLASPRHTHSFDMSTAPNHNCGAILAGTPGYGDVVGASRELLTPSHAYGLDCLVDVLVQAVH
jgi:multiple RNA-binding domain-containing protein 1